MLSTVTDTLTDRAVTYTYAEEEDYPCAEEPWLVEVSQVAPEGETGQMRWKYAYLSDRTSAFLNTVESPSPKDDGSLTTFTLAYNSAGKVASQTDALGSTRRYFYCRNGITYAEVLDKGKNLVGSWSLRFGAGPSAGDPVNLASGVEAYTPAADLNIYNPVGPAVVFQRACYSGRAKNGTHTPGLSPGWVLNYDIYLQGPATTGNWGALTLQYPKGAWETLTPELNGAQPTGRLFPPAGSPYLVSGVSGSMAGQWQAVTITWKEQTQWTFTPHASGVYALTRITNRMGRYLTLNWDTNRRLLNVTNDVSTVLLSCVYGTDTLTVTDAYNRKVVYAFTIPAGVTMPCLTTVSQIGAANEPTPAARYTFGYSAYMGQPLLHTLTVPSPTGTDTETATINYDGTGRVISRVDANGNQFIYTTAPTRFNQGKTTVEVKDDQDTVHERWTQRYRNLRSTGKADGHGRSDTIEYEDAANPYQPTRTTAPDGKVSSATYDRYGNVTSVTSPRGVTTIYTYNYSTFALGRLGRMREGNKTPTTYSYYEPSGLVKTVTSPKPGSTTGEVVTTTYTYDALGNVLTETRPGNNAAGTITIRYNYTDDGSFHQNAAMGQPLTTTDGAGCVTHFQYDTRGNRTLLTDAGGHQTEISYNRTDQPEEIKFRNNTANHTVFRRVQHVYEYPGGMLTRTDIFDGSGQYPLRQVRYTYGAEGELKTRTGDTEAVTYTYDATYRQKTLADGKENTTSYNYDPDTGVLTKVTYPGGETIQYPAYDEAGRLLERVDGNGVHTTYLYNDPEGQVTDIQYPATPGQNVHYTYDNYGRRLSMTDATGTTSYGDAPNDSYYDSLDNPLSVTTTFADITPAQPKTISYTYYPDGSRASMTVPTATGYGTFSYQYNTSGQLVSLRNPFGRVATWRYQPDGRLERQTLGNRAWTTYAYNANGQLSRLTNRSPKGRLNSEFTDLQYNGIGDLQQFRAVVPGLPAFSGVTTYTYDSKRQLLQETSTRNGGYTHGYQYDLAGNPTLFNGVSHHTYNANNQVVETGFDYDENGNPDTYQGGDLDFDAENRLTVYRDNSDTVLMTAGYNGKGLRAWKDGQQGKVYCLYDGERLVAELDANNSVQAVMTWGARGLVSRNDNWDQFDLQGSVLHRLDAKGKVLSTDLYDAWGKQLAGNDDDPYGYNGRWGYYTDHETGLILCTHRYYHPASGRFLTLDPLGTKGGVNLYSYVQNNPANRIDSAGKHWYCLWLDDLWVWFWGPGQTITVVAPEGGQTGLTGGLAGAGGAVSCQKRSVISNAKSIA